MDRKHRLRAKRQRAKCRKILVLTHYSPKKNLGCSWPGCKETDLQCLTLDHQNNNGADHRRLIGRSSTALYRWIVQSDFPKGFRCLCGSHQLKSELQRRIRNRVKYGEDECEDSE